MERLVSFENEFLETKLEHDGENPDVFASITIDGYPAGEQASGRVVAVVYVTKSGDVVTDWHENDYRSHETVKELVEESKAALLGLYADRDAG